MKRELAVSFAAAVTCHALLLFAFRLGTTAKPLALSDEGSPVVVNLIQPSAETPSAPREAAATPAPSPVPHAHSRNYSIRLRRLLLRLLNAAVMSTPAPLPQHHEKPKPHMAASASTRKISGALPVFHGIRRDNHGGLGHELTTGLSVHPEAGLSVRGARGAPGRACSNT